MTNPRFPFLVPNMPAYKNRLLMLLAPVFALLAASCNDGKTTTGDLSKNGTNALNARKQVTDNPTPSSPKSDAPYFGEDWATNSPLRPASAGAANDASAKAGQPARGSQKAGAANPAPPATSTWSLILGTFTGADHVEAANRMIADLPKIAPEIRGARVHTTSAGSMVIYGNYTSDDDPAAKADEAHLKTMAFQGHKVFNRIMLTRLDLRMQQGQLNPYDLLSARVQHPKVDPLYTLDIAIWIANDDPKMGGLLGYDEVKRKAEAYATQLRTQGQEAYFYHDEINKRSIVTVGLFDHRAINSMSGFYSDEVKELVKRFPARLNNGEPLSERLYVPTAKDRASTYTKPQTPVLVMVPKL